MNPQLVLAGNPNSGKTTLFNRLTGTRQITGNWPGVTVAHKSGQIRLGSMEAELIDLPGTYSLNPCSPDETITREYLLDKNPDVVINIVDATNLERNLYLTLQLLKLGRPLVVALNMMDEVHERGDKLDVSRLSEILAVPVVPVSARKGTGISNLLSTIGQANRQTLTKKLEPAGNQPVETDAETAALYDQAAAIVSEVLHPGQSSGAPTRSDRIDRLLTHRFLAIPLFLTVMFLVFQITFHEHLGGRLTSLLDDFFSHTIHDAAIRWLDLAAAPQWIHTLLVGGILAGVGGILTFLPQIALLFFFLSILEETGYMARAAFIMDRVFQQFGLSGRSFIPMLMGFGCTVPAVMAARTLENERDRRLTILITPFMSCGARMPIYAFFTGIFFTAHKGLVTFSMYLLGIAVAMLAAMILSRTVLRGADAPFIIELPTYRLPDLRSLLLHVWDKVRDFIIRAGTVIFIMTLVVWFCQTFDFRLHMVQDSAASIIGIIGSWLAPLLKPLGFGSWQTAVALLTGLVAKESVVATLEILFTPDTLLASFNPLTAYAFMTFTLLYTPCLAALGAIRREMNSWRWTLAAIVFQTVTAWSLSFLIYRIGLLFL